MSRTSTLTPRLLGKSEAAEYCGCSISCFTNWVAKGILPKPVAGTHRWDKKAIDKILDEKSGITNIEAEQDHFNAWKNKYDARKITRNS